MCKENLKTKKEYKTHLKIGHSVSNPKDMMKMLQMEKNEVTKKIIEEAKTVKGYQENIKSVWVNVKNINIKNDNSDANRDDFKGVTWFNRVKFECLKCKRICYGRWSLHNHLRYGHKIWTKRKIQLSFCLLSKDEYSCKICKLSLKMCYSTIKYHLITIHGIKISEYEAEYEPGKRFGKRKLKSLEKKGRECGFHGVKWYDRVKYKCLDCDKTVDGLTRIRYHSQKIHGKKHVNINDYSALTNDLYSCKICEKEIKLNTASIYQHLRYTHDMNMSTYGAKFEETDRRKERRD